MKLRHSSMIWVLLVVVVLFGAAFKCGADHHAPSPNTSAEGLKTGEYACYGSEGRILIGLGFKVLAGNRYTDLDDGNKGSFSIEGDTVTFRGGHLDGQVGRGLKDYKFTIRSASCEPF